jgi:hypothetical protein
LTVNRTSQPVSLGGAQLGKQRHVCAFFANDEEEYRVLLPFVREGFSRGDRAVHVVNPEQRDEHLSRLAGQGIDTAAHQHSGQLQIQNNTEVYLRDGRFDQNRMLAAFEEVAASTRTAGKFPSNRIVCRMDWAASGDPSRIEDVIEFESRVNDVWDRYDDTVICTYHLGKFRGDHVIDIMRTHPVAIIGGLLQQNPFFTRPDEFLRDYREQRRKRAS